MLEIALAVEPAVVLDDLRYELDEERAAIGGWQCLRDVPGGNGNKRGLRDARRLDVARRFGVLHRLPDATASDVVHTFGEDHVRQHAVGPLPAEQRAQLPGRAGGS